MSLESYNELLDKDHALPGKLDWTAGSLFIIELAKLPHEGSIDIFKDIFVTACGGLAHISPIGSTSSFRESCFC